MTKDEALRLALEALEFDSFYATGKQEAITAIKAALEAKDEPDAYGYAKRLAEAIWSKHYKTIAPQWEPFDELIGVLTQIDNMTAGLISTPQQEAKDEPVDFEAIIDDIEAIDCRYRGDPSYDRDAYWMRDEVVATVKRHASFYTTPPQRKPLTEKELNVLGAQWHFNLLEAKDKADLFALARAIEAAHGIKGEA
jgi:hypothetical protein